MEYDILIVGAGPAGLSAAIRLKQLAQQENTEIRVCILEKGAQVGSHILSGAVLEPRTLQELLPADWQEAPLDTAVSEDFFYFLTKNKAFKLPTPAPMHNKGNYIISLGELCRFLAAKAEALGCEIYPGFPAAKLLFNNESEVIGVSTGEVGIGKNFEKTANYQPGMHIHAKQVFLAEGCRGSLSRKVISRFRLNAHSNPQTYALGIKEVWQVKPENHHLGRVIHTVGWPLQSNTYGGSFLYHLSNDRVALGFVIGLDYKNTWLDPYEELQRFKTHPAMIDTFKGGERIFYGARSLIEGGWQSLPKLTFPGGALIGDSAGFMNVPKIKGTHTAMKSGMLAAEAYFEAFRKEQSNKPIELTEYPKKVEKSWIKMELYKVRNIRPGFKYGLIPGLINAGFETYISRGLSPWTLKNHADYSQLRPAKFCEKIIYPKHDGVLTFDKLSSVYHSNTYHEENQPSHIRIKQEKVMRLIEGEVYQFPSSRYCPAGVFEVVSNEENQKMIHINAQNCLHCKTCDIKDPRQNIIWTTPEGGGGPNYVGM